MKRILATAIALVLTLGVAAASTGAAHASVVRNSGSYTLSTTVTYTCTSSGTSVCPTAGTTYTRSYDIVGDCATNAFTGIGTGPAQTGETLTGQVSGNDLSFSVNFGSGFTNFTGSFTSPSTYTGNATNTYNGSAVTDTFSATGVITNADFSQCAPNHGQYVRSQGGGPTAAHSPIGMPVQSNP